jgi:tRNA(His) 5'-end guanylyltransferase
MATMAFNKFLRENFDKWGADNLPDWYEGGTNEDVDDELIRLCRVYDNAINKGAMFDSRCLNIPESEVTNCFIWRQQDATRNAIQMLGQCIFSHKELQNKSCNDIQDMLMVQKGINFNDMPTEFKRGVCCVKEQYAAEDLSTYSGPIESITRTHWIIDKEIPIFTQDRNYIERNFKEAN